MTCTWLSHTLLCIDGSEWELQGLSSPPFGDLCANLVFGFLMDEHGFSG